MDVPNTADPASSLNQERLLSRRRFWRWGIGFWLLLWIFSILAEVGLQIDLKDQPGMMLGAGYGTLVVALNHQDVSEVNDIERHGPFFIWSERNQRLHSKHPEFLFAWLGGVVWKTSGNRHTIALPVSGFLWFWLIGGWVVWVSKNQRPDFRGKRIMVQAATLILLPVVMFQATHTMNKVLAESDVSGCHMNLRNLQCMVRSYQGMQSQSTGDPITWNKIIGPDGFFKQYPIPTCPRAGDYILKSKVNHNHDLVAECPDPDHMRRLKAIDTSGW